MKFMLIITLLLSFISCLSPDSAQITERSQNKGEKTINSSQCVVDTQQIDLPKDSSVITENKNSKNNAADVSQSEVDNLEKNSLAQGMLITKTNADGTAVRTNTGPPITEVQKANQEALQEPNIIQNSVIKYVYHEQYMYRIYTTPQRVTMLKLAKNESVVGDLVSGDTANWIIAIARDKSRSIIYIKPVQYGVSTNLIINTSKRSYNLMIMSTPETYMVTVEWQYPSQELLGTNSTKTALEMPVSLDRLYFGYKILTHRKKPSWAPIKVFDDGTKTFIQFKSKLDIAESPVLFLIENRKDVLLVNYRVIENYYVVDRILSKAELRIGNKKHNTVKIVRLKK